MKSWKTTVAGFLGLVGGILQVVPGPAWLRDLGGFLAGLGGFSVGIFARDNKRTSEEVGAGR